ncbi:MAG: tetratricopeptide repeat protein [Acidiferrobacterales bacterium]
MSGKPAIYDATIENFSTRVIENSRKGPVVVNFGSFTAAPCGLTLGQLSSLKTEFGGRFLLVHVDTDAQADLSRQCDVQSIPSTHMYINGERVEGVCGAESEASFRRVLNKYLPRIAGPARVKAHAAYEAGEVEKALTLLAQAAMEDPDDIDIPLDLAKLLMREGRHQQAMDLLSCLPEEFRKQKNIAGLLGHLDFIVAANTAEDTDFLIRAIRDNPGALDQRFQLAAQQLLSDNYEAALNELFKLHQQDPEYNNARARRGLLTIFNMLGDDSELVQSYRRKLLENC